MDNNPPPPPFEIPEGGTDQDVTMDSLVDIEENLPYVNVNITGLQLVFCTEDAMKLAASIHTTAAFAITDAALIRVLNAQGVPKELIENITGAVRSERAKLAYEVGVTGAPRPGRGEMP